jgi:hypothetical protein
MFNYEEYVKAVKATALTTAKKALISALLRKVPFLFWGPFGAVTSLLVGKLLETLFEQAEFAIYFKYTDLRVDKQGVAFAQVAMDNYKIQKTGTEDEKIQSEKRLIECFKNFISFHT